MQAQNLIEFGEYPEVYADGIGDMQVIGRNLHVVLYRWRRVDGLFRRVINCEVIREFAVVQEEFVTWRKLLDPDMVPAAASHLVH